MKTFTTWKRICGILLAIALMLPGFALPSYAAGSYTVSGTYDPGVDITDGFTYVFDLYTVGGFDRTDDGKSILVLDDTLKTNLGSTGNIRLDIQRSEYAEGAEGDQQWTEDWLAQAKALDDMITNYEAENGTWPTKEEPKHANMGAGKTFSFAGVPNGLYLLSSDSRMKVEGANNNSTYYFPQPMLIQVLNGNFQVVVKPDTERVKNFTVRKAWADEGKEALRPAEVTINLNYGDTPDRVVKFSKNKVEVTFNNDAKIAKETYIPDPDDKNKTQLTTEYKTGAPETKTIDAAFVNELYTWETPDLEKAWSVAEVMDDQTARNYVCVPSVVQNEQNEAKVITLTNTYQRNELEIVKKTDKLAKLSDGSNITAVFKIEGFKNGSEAPVYTDHVSAVIDNTEIKLDAKNIPLNIDTLKVTEVYSGGNYTANGGTTKEATFVVAEAAGEQAETGEGEAAPAKTNYWSVVFQNDLNEDITVISSGIVNKFDKAGKIVEREGKRVAEEARD